MVSIGSWVWALADLHVFRSAEGVVVRGSHVHHLHYRFLGRCAETATGGHLTTQSLEGRRQRR